MKTLLLKISACAILFPLACAAASITPTSYTYTGGTPAGEPGYFAYDDPAMSKLTDGNTGTTAVGDGTWTGWQHGDSGAAQIAFTFASSVTITSVAIDFLRSDNANTQLPESVTIGGINFLTADFATDDTKGFASYSGSWTGNSLAVSLNHNTNHWIFVNEARFTTDPTATPEPTTMALAGVSFAGLVFARRRSISRLKRSGIAG